LQLQADDEEPGPAMEELFGTPSIPPWLDCAIGVGILNRIGPLCQGKGNVG
jgi:hypothetical protein